MTIEESEQPRADQGWQTVDPGDLPLGGESLHTRVASYAGEGKVTPELLTARFGLDPGLAQRLLDELAYRGFMQRCTGSSLGAFRRMGETHPAQPTATPVPKSSSPSSFQRTAEAGDDEPPHQERSCSVTPEPCAESLRLVLVAAARFAPLTLDRVAQISGSVDDEDDSAIDLVGGLVEGGHLVLRNGDDGFEWVAV